MKSLKKYISILLVLSLILASFSACGGKNNNASNNTDPAEPVTVRIGSLTGPTTIGLVKLLSDAEAGTTANKYESKIAGSADELTPLMIKGELDVLVGPSNLASVLYNKTEGKVQMAAITTLGVLYIYGFNVGDQIKGWNDLKGRTIYATGKGSVPEYALTHLLRANGLEPGRDVTIEFKSEPAEIASLIETSTSTWPVYMFPQPYAASVMRQYESKGLSLLFDVPDEWARLGNGDMVTACIMVRKEFAQANPGAVRILLQEYAASAEWVNSNVSEAAELTEKYINIKAVIGRIAIPQCKVVCITGREMKRSAQEFFRVLYEQNPASVGGKLPDDDFYLQ